jgi:hypothetical protein
MNEHGFCRNVFAAATGKWADERMRLSAIIKVPPHKKAITSDQNGSSEEKNHQSRDKVTVRSLQNFCTEEMLTRSFSEWASSMSGPKEIMSRPG